MIWGESQRGQEAALLGGRHPVVNKVAPRCTFVTYKPAYEESALTILDYLGVHRPGELRLDGRVPEQQADGRSEEWVQCYREEKQRGWWAQFW